jgi:hypothetical protein
MAKTHLTKTTANYAAVLYQFFIYLPMSSEPSPQTPEINVTQTYKYYYNLIWFHVRTYYLFIDSVYIQFVGDYIALSSSPCI